MKMKKFYLVILVAVIVACGQGIPKKESISQFGITWTFEKPVHVGQFVNGDYYVVGPVSIIKIDPAPENYKNGSVLNVPAEDRGGYDKDMPGKRFDTTLYASLPIKMRPGDAVVSTISADSVGSMPCMARESDMGRSIVRTAAVLTCLGEPVSKDAFRPGYSDRKQVIYHADKLNRVLLPKLAKVDSIPSLSEFERYTQRPWIDHVYDGFGQPVENMPCYGREVGRIVGMATLLLCLDFTRKEKEKLLVNLVQIGIDNWGLVKSGHPGWHAHGGHGTGRKLPMLFAGLMLDNGDMQNPYKKFPKLSLGEDQQTLYAESWTGGKAIYAGHYGRDGHPKHDDWGPYEHLSPDKWPGTIGESYRRCCTSIAWVGQALAMDLLKAKDVWNQPSFFDYVERWMTEDDTEHVKIIKKAKKGDFEKRSWARGGQAWDVFVDQMYKKYRAKK